MANDRTPILFPVARMVNGDLYTPNEKDADGNQLIVKNGPNAGQKRVEYYLAIAIPKDGRPWWETEWGKLIYQAGAAAFPQAVSMPTFAWKIKDGDDASPRMGKGGKPAKPYNQREGWAGHWIIGISSGYAPKIVNSTGTQEITEPGAVKCGYYVQVFGNVGGNGSATKPGVHINHNGIALAGYGKEISSGVDLASVGFGGALPAGASAVPLAGMTAVPPAAPAAPGVPAMPGAPGVPAMPGAQVGVPAMPAGFPGAAVPAMPAAPAAGVPQIAGVVPNPAFLQVPGTPAAPVAPAAPPAAPVRQMTAAANGVTYEAYRQAGWTDEQLVAHQLMTA
jgi:hypothetical protein